jgi:hypothetical protein
MGCNISLGVCQRLNIKSGDKVGCQSETLTLLDLMKIGKETTLRLPALRAEECSS